MKISTIIIACLFVAGVRAATVDSSGRNSYFWVSLKPSAGSSSSKAEDLSLNNGYRVSNLASPNLSCTQVEESSSLIYRVTWKGNHFVGSPEADTLTFDIKVEGFSGSTFTYGEKNPSSVTALGKPAGVDLVDDAWGVDGAKGVNEGQTGWILRWRASLT